MMSSLFFSFSLLFLFGKGKKKSKEVRRRQPSKLKPSKVEGKKEK